jgi:hypothetical protein
MLEELGRGDLSCAATRRIIVLAIAQHADDLRCERLVQQLADLRAAFGIVGRHGAALHVLSRTRTDGLHVRDEACRAGP